MDQERALRILSNQEHWELEDWNEAVDVVKKALNKLADYQSLFKAIDKSDHDLTYEGSELLDYQESIENGTWR